jgi:Domain of unknown function (DUF4352)/Protein of unknown function (DUF2510)
VSRTPVPGLYPDPSGAPWLRYWNGEQWTGRMPLPPKPSRDRQWITLRVIAVVALFLGGGATLVAIGAQSHKTSGSDMFRGLASSPGAPVREGNFEFVVTDVSTPANRSGDPRPRGQWIIATMTVRNIDDESQEFVANNQKLIDSAGHTYAADARAAVAMNKSSMVININPGINIMMKVPFDVPAGTLPTAVEVHDSVFSSGARVRVN